MSFLRELKRRNVFRAGIAYLAVGWLLLQVADTLIPALQLPEWFITVVAVLLILGFPVAVLLAWAFELTPEGVRRETRSTPSAPVQARFRRRFDLAIIGLLVVALGYFVWESRIRAPSASDAVRTQTEDNFSIGAPISIAVLPFANTSPDPDQEYFSDGITEEILNRLARIDRLAVTSRTSAFAFKDSSQSIPEIAATLGVDHVLEGSVRKSGNRIRISAQLIEVDGDRHLWADVYERNLTDIFAVHDEISTNIAAALELNLLGDGIGAWESRRVDPEAYDLYLHGLEIASAQTVVAGNRSAELFEQALAIDPLFVRPRAALAWKQVMWLTNGLVSPDEYLPKIREHIELGLQIDPDNAGLIGVTAQLAYFEGDFAEAARLFRNALDQEPPYYNAEFWYPLVLQLLGKLDLAQQFVRDTLQRDPLNISTGLILAHMYSESGDFQASLDAASRLEIIAPGNPYPVFNRGYVKIVYRGDLASGLADFNQAAQFDVKDYELHSMLSTVLVDLGLVDQADRWIEDATNLAPDATTVLGAQAYRLAHGGNLQAARDIALRALVEHVHFDRWWGGFLTMRLAVDALLDQDQPVRATELILEAEPDWVALRDESPRQSPQLSDNPGYYNSGAVRLTDYLPDFVRALRAADDQDGANNVLAHHEQIIRWRRENGFVVWATNVAELHALRGNTDQALGALEEALQSGTIFAYVDHKLFRNRILDSLRDEPRFRDVVQRARGQLARQHAIVTGLERAALISLRPDLTEIEN